ncbi:C4-dicarboxylate TRAP transporter substrate-binding protein [Marinobacter sp. SS21]|uniref:C4-dicarboxylate TRAP transporter substrate-binding protein n=1 Tax=Marinobacter sp. SS21 TaxID=2979460 RepID=UPI00232CB033|nr:C4-dicarboxylate TRAP transporter substrate-binding protein [Marinobacter sp. SS21]MDC0662974.1 C4-dicarboxylate TRAP transporter substrate-binding protein [Marinobacter sp. SS21]
MMPKKSLRTALLAASLGLASAGHAVAGLTLRYAEGTPNRGTRADAVQHFAELVEQKSGGELKLDIHWGGALLKYSAIMDGVASGTADMGAVLAAYQPQELKGLSIGDLPLAHSDPWVGLHAMYDLMTGNEQIRASMAAQDLVYLGNFTTTGVQFECTAGNEIRSVADIAGKRIRASVTYAKVLDDLGANLVNMTYGDIYQALDTGLADCNSGYFYAMRAFKTPEVTASVTQVDWGQIMGFAMVMNRYMWEDLSNEQQRVLLDSAEEMIDQYARRLIEESEGVRAALPTGELGNKVEIIRMAPEERQRLIDASGQYIQQWIREMDAAGFDGQGIWNEYTELLAKYEQEREARGYPWQR